ncbi:histidinol dehydrogenase [uncultured Microscilla sp.]|uniref:histidinol dehydrogenase n=1 Tax=uncultured Microscilla sp. TaxID=432653 RepID=UPI002614B1F4|nr:histidinol dehydrogenase [uncultured Microscilla sp.]
MEKIIHPHKEDWSKLQERTFETYEALEKAVRPILRRVQREGDKALRSFVFKYDRVRIKRFQLTPEELAEASNHVSDELKEAINTAKYNIATFHLTQTKAVKKIETTEGVFSWQKNVPIAKVGLYVPSTGDAPLYSHILMMGILANIAGCKEIILCSAANHEGRIHPIILYTAHLLNIKKVYRVGGVQAIAAMAYGTETIPKVDKIFGPSNEYVSTAKQLVSKNDVAIDMPVGPSELCYVADQSTNPVYAAADILAHAEQSNHNQLVVLTNAEEVADKIQTEVNKQLSELPLKKEVAKETFKNAKIIVFKSNVESIAFANEYAPENLVLAIDNAEAVGDRITNASSIHLGHLTPPAVGYYAAGPNHILPSNGFARSYSGLSVDSFVKKINFQQVTSSGLQNIGSTVAIMSEAEELLGRKNSIIKRLELLD